MKMGLRLRYGLLALLVLVIEIVIATTHAPPFVRASLGDLLVVILLYFLVKAIHDFRAMPLAIGVFSFACLIEGLQYIHLVDLLRLRHGSVLAIMIGNTFSFGDIAMYALGCLTVLGLDTWMRRRII